VKIVLTEAITEASTTRSTSRQWSRKSSTTGSRETVLCCSNTGVSVSLRRITYPTAMTTTLAQKGIRQPQASSASSGSAATGRNAAVARI
jgi:hypothetical protein